MVNRKKTLEMMSSIPARMEQIRYEAKKHGGVLPAVDRVYKPTPLVRPEIDDLYLKQNYDLVKRFTPGPLDTLFDHTVLLGTATDDKPPVFTPAAGTQIVMWSYRVPPGQRFILNQYTFGALIDNEPVVEYNEFARPFEFLSPIAGVDFLILANGKVPMNATYGLTNAAGVNITIEGWACMSTTPISDSNPNYGGIIIPFPSGTKIDIIFRNHGYTYASVLRDIVAVFCKLRGFLSPVNPEEK